MATGIFRRAALERFSTPDRLDQPVRIFPVWTWIALIALLLVLSVGVVASIFITVSEKIPGNGMVIAQTGILEIPLPGGGRLIETRSSIGDQVSRGQVVAMIENTELRHTLDEARKIHRDAQEQRRQVAALHGIAARARADADLRRQRDLQQTIALIQRRLGLLQERASQDPEYRVQAVPAGVPALDPQMAIWSAEEELAVIQRLMNDIDLASVQADIRDRRELMEFDLKVEAAAGRAALIEEQLRRSEEVVSPYSGMVVELKHDIGRIVQKGGPLMTLLPGASAADAEHAGPLRVILFVPANDGKRITPGMTVEISPSTTVRVEDGFMLARVTRVAHIPTTAEGMVHLLKNQQLAASLSAGGPAFAVDVELLPDPATPSGFVWSFTPGPTVALSPGTLATGHVRVRNRRLIEFAVPATRGLFADSLRPSNATTALGHGVQ